MIISFFTPLAFTNLSPDLLFFHPKNRLSIPSSRSRPSSTLFSARFAASSGKNTLISSSINPNPPRSLFHQDYRRPEIKVPNVVLRLTGEEVLRDDAVFDIIDGAISNGIGIVVLTDGEGSGKKLYEAACLLKSVIRDRAYLLIDERVDIAAAVNASGVLLSDHGLPTIVARNTLIGAKKDSVILPLVARNVQTHEAALDASNSEGADFLIYTIKEDHSLEELLEYASGIKLEDGDQSFDNLKTLGMENGFYGKKMIGGFTRLEESEKQFIDRERSILLEAIDVIESATPLMGDISLLKDAVSQLNEPFFLVIVGEFNSGKSTFINAFLGQRYLKDGVVPTTNDITFLRYSDSEFCEQCCERHLDGQSICYIPAPILKEMIIVDTPGTNVILQRQQRLTEEFVPRADLIIFILSADRPLTESEVHCTVLSHPRTRKGEKAFFKLCLGRKASAIADVAHYSGRNCVRSARSEESADFLRYIQQWKKKIVFVLNKSDLYRTTDELEEAIAFIKENTRKMLNVEQVTLYPVSARSALEAKLSAFSRPETQEQFSNNPYLEANSFYDLEKYLYSFLDVSTDNGIERIRLKLQTPVKIAEQLLSSCQKLLVEECQQAERDLVMVNNLLSSVKEFALKMENESISWKRQILSLISNTLARAVKLADSTLQLSNLDLVTSYVLKGDKSAQLPVTSSLRNEIIDPAVSEAQKLLGEYSMWLQSNNAREGSMYKELFEKRWPLVVPSILSQLEANELLRKKHELSVTVIEDFSSAAASKLFEQEIREIVLGTFGGLGAAGLSASLLTSVLPTTSEDLLALGICSAGGLLAISNFGTRRQKVVDKVRRTADAFACQLEEAMEKDLLESTNSLNNFVTIIGKPYKELAQDRVNKLLRTLDQLKAIEGQLETLQIGICNLDVSR
ncbi:hypothetical protein OROGR_024946 [Orobanche gracilis]